MLDPELTFYTPAIAHQGGWSRLSRVRVANLF
jgi:hypothetical protein